MTAPELSSLLQNGVRGQHSGVVLLACGSFNPPTRLHMEMFTRSRDVLARRGMHVVAGVMSPVNDGYGKPALAPGARRVEMCRLAARAIPWVVVDPWEAEQSEHVRTVFALRRLRDVVEAAVGLRAPREGADKGSHSTGPITGADATPSAGPGAPRVMLLCGTDLLASFAIPGVWREDHKAEILRDFGVVCCSRAGQSVEDVSATLPGQVRELALSGAIDAPMHPNSVSSTAVRASIACGDWPAVHSMVDEAVVDYVRRHGLYGAPSDAP